MMKFKTYARKIPLFWLMGVLMLPSCEEEIDWDHEPEDMETVVVDAIITNEFRKQVIRLTKPFGALNGDPTPVTGAQVFVSYDDEAIFFYESGQLPGYYLTETEVAAAIDREYILTVVHQSGTYTATSGMVPVLPVNQYPRFIPAEEAGMYKFVFNSPEYSQAEQAMYEALISWDHMVDPGLTDTVTHAKLTHYTFNTIDVSYVIFPQDKEQLHFPHGSIAVVKKYSLTGDFAAYLRALVAETEWQGSLFEDARGNLPTNISNGGLGYFSACSVLTDTLIAGSYNSFSHNLHHSKRKISSGE